MKRVTIQDIAEKAGVSITTVSVVLNDQSDTRKIKPATREKIWNVVKELNYKPSSLARSLRGKGSKTIGFLAYDISDEFFANIIRIVEDIAWEKGYRVLAGSTEESVEKEVELIDDLIGRQVEGLIIASTNPDSDKIKTLVQSGFPLVLIDRKAEAFQANSIIVNNQLIMQKAVDRIIRVGKEKIGLMSIMPLSFPLKHRIEGYKTSLSNHHIAYSDELIKYVDRKTLKESAFEKFEELMDKNIDGLVITNNKLSYTVFDIIFENYGPVINNLTFAVFDDAEIFKYIHSYIVSVVQPVNKIAEHAIALLLKNINGDNLNHQIVLKGELMVRHHN